MVSEWAVQTIQAILEFYHSIWKHQNKVKFGSTKKAQNTIQRNTLLDRIESAYVDKDKFLAIFQIFMVQDYFNGN